MQELVAELTTQLKAIWRYRWYAVVFGWLIAIGGWTFIFLMPDRYKVDTQVYLDNESVLRPLLAGISVQPDLDQIAAFVSQTMVNRSNLERLIRMADLDIGLNSENDWSRLMAKLVKGISIKSVGRANLYTISFADEDPRMAKRIVESLLELFVERSLDDNREDSDSARRFIDEQLDSYRGKLEEAERNITKFKRTNLEVLPGAGPGYFDRIVEVKGILRQAELELKVAEDSAISIRKQLAIAVRNTPSTQRNAGLVETVKPDTPLDIRILSLGQRLDELRLRYTEQHPDIIAAVSMMTELQKRKAAEDARAKIVNEQRDARARLTGQNFGAGSFADPVIQQLTVSLASAEAEVAAKRTTYAEYRRRYAELQSAANAVPAVEAEYTQLTRDYDVTKARYDELLKRREIASISEDMESSNATMGFRVIDPPKILDRTEPNRQLMMTLVLLAAIGGGVSVAWFVGQVRPTINDERSLKEVSGLPVLGTVVMAWTKEQKTRRNWWTVAFFTSCASLISAYAAIMTMLVLTMTRA